MAMMSFWYCYCYLKTNFTKCSINFIVEFEQADDNWVICPCSSLPAISASFPTVIIEASVSTSEHLRQRCALKS